MSFSLYPFHDWAMPVLKRLPQYGTFDQLRPIASRMRPYRVFSLSSATDRWPVHFIFRVVEHLFGPLTGSWSVLGTLSASVFSVYRPLIKSGTKLIYLTTGKPLGYYGSWALFSLFSIYWFGWRLGLSILGLSLIHI